MLRAVARLMDWFLVDNASIAGGIMKADSDESHAGT